MKKGRKFVVSLEDQKNAFSRYKNVFASFHNLPPASDPVYTEIKSALPKPISEKALLLSVKKNFNYFFDVTAESDDNLSICSGLAQNEKSSCKSVHIDFMIDLHQWQKLQPVSQHIRVTENGKSTIKSKYRLPKHTWAHLLREQIWKVTKNPCSWIFRHYSIKNGERIICKGSCKQCKSSIKIVITWPVDKIAHCMCIITNVDSKFVHKSDKKIKLSPVKRFELSVELKSESAIVCRNKLANEIMETGDTEPAHMPTVGCLRQIKHEAKQNLHYDTNQVLSLWIMTRITPYKEAIRHISLYPFYLYYWAHSQETCCKKMNQLDRLVLSIDATGSIFKDVGPTNKMLVTKHLFLYVLMMKTQENVSSVPVSQMISECQKMDTIHQWLQAWSKCNPVPDEINLDDSSALIGAAVKAFTKHDTTAKYVEDSYKCLEDGKANEKCYIRIDTSHFTKILFNLSCFKHTDIRVKFFYAKCLMELKNCDDYAKAKDIILDLIVVCLNERDGVNKDQIPVRCEIAKNKLKMLSTFGLKDTEIEIKDSDKLNEDIKDASDSIFQDTLQCNPSEQKNVTLPDQKYPQWFTNRIDAEKMIITLSDENDFGNHENLYYFPAFVEVLSRLMSQFPLWSNVMKNLYNSNIERPTSSCVESYFKNMKRLLLQIGSKAQRLRIDEFLIKHLEYLTGEIKVAESKINAEKKTSTKKSNIITTNKRKVNKVSDFTDDSVFSDQPSLIENWRGLGAEKSKRKKQTADTNKKVLLLSNGGRFIIDKEIVITKNTCALDSACQALALAYIDGCSINPIIQGSNHMLSQLLRSMCEKNNEEVYKIRTSIARNYFKNDHKGDIVEVDCECNVLYIFDRILIECSLYSAEERESCTNTDCPINKVIRKVSVLRLHDRNVTDLQESANALLNNMDITPCRHSTCDGIKSFELTLNNLVCFEISEQPVSVYDAPTKLCLQSKEYELLSIIEFVPPSTGTMGHYKAHCRRNNIWQCYDDMNTRVVRSSNKKVIPHCIIYVNRIKLQDL